jgi:hypothetical protein
VKTLFYIKEGVRRAVAAREAGLSSIPARIIELGKPDVDTRVLLDQLYSPKRVIPRDYRYIRDTEYPTLVLKTEPPPLDIEPLGAPGQAASIPLAQVILR